MAAAIKKVLKRLKLIFHRVIARIYMYDERKRYHKHRNLSKMFIFSLKRRAGSFHSQESESVGQKSQGIFANRAQGLNDQRKRHAIIFIVNCDQSRRRGGGG